MTDLDVCALLHCPLPVCHWIITGDACNESIDGPALASCSRHADVVSRDFAFRFVNRETAEVQNIMML